MSRDCLIRAVLSEERFGIWGGYTFEERRRGIQLTENFRSLMAHFDGGTLSGLVVKLHVAG